MMANANATAKKPRKSTKPAAASESASDELISMLDNIEIRYTSYSRLFIGDLNVRNVPHSDAELREYADSILAVGLIHNLIVVICDDGRLEVVGGGGRTKSIGLLVADGKVDPDKEWIAYKAVPRELARAVSQIENDKRKDMHPADQIMGFRALAKEGKTPGQIGGLFGYGEKHVQRMLKLASLDPELLATLARDEITLEQCKVMTQVEPSRQLEVWEAVKQSGYDKYHIDHMKSMVAKDTTRTTSPMFRFIGKDAWLAAGHTIDEDLFSENEGGYVDRFLLQSMVCQKLEAETLRLQQLEGWAWSSSRLNPLTWYEDRKAYELDEPEAQFTDEEQAVYDELEIELEAATTFDDENEIQQKIEDMEAAAIARLMTPEYLAERGVFVSFVDGDFNIQRGVKKVAEKEGDEPEPKTKGSVTTLDAKSDVAEGISLPLLTSMSSERTLAVQAALMQQTQRSVAILAWTLCQSVFGGTSYSNPVQIRLTCSHSSLTSHAPSRKEGAAYLALMKEETRLNALLPVGWKKDFTTFFSLADDVVYALLGYCTAVSIDGVQTRECGRTSVSKLNALEGALEFHLRDWWQPPEIGYFGQISKPMIVAALKDAGLTGAASDAEKMKKRDAAELAAEKVAETRWVPAWMSAPQPAPIADDLTMTDNAA